MQNKIKQIGRYVSYLLWSNVIYGLIVYHVFIWLARYSLLFAYLGNLALIMLGLLIDEYTIQMLQSQKLVRELMEDKKNEKNYQFVQRIMDSFISFKTALYLFYLFILVFSQMITLHPSLVGENIQNFIKANDYSILFLLALDTLIAHFSKDREKMKKISDTLKKSLTLKQE